MIRLPLAAATLALTLATAGTVGCASSSAASHAPPHEAPPTRAIPLLATSDGESPREARIILKTPALKLAAIALRRGTILPDHDAPVPVTITALRGAGVVTAGGERLRLDPDHVVVLAPGVVHAVIPEPGTDMLLLVHHIGEAPPKAHDEQDHHEHGHH